MKKYRAYQTIGLLFASILTFVACDNGQGFSQNGSVYWSNQGTAFSGAFGWDSSGVSQTALFSGTSCDSLESSVDIINGFSQDPCAFERNDNGTPFTGTINGTVCNSADDSQRNHTVTCSNGRITDTSQDVVFSLPYILVGNYSDSTLSVLDTTTNTVVETISLSDNPQGIAITSDNETAYVTGAGDTVMVVDLVTFAEVTSFTVSNNPLSIALTPDDATLYVVQNSGGSVPVIDAVSHATTTTIPSLLTFGGRAALVTPDGTKAYFVDNGSANIAVVDTNTNTPLSPIATTSVAEVGLAITQDGSTLYATGLDADNIYVIDTSTDTISSTIPMASNPWGIAISPDGTRLVVGSNDSTDAYIINTATEAITPVDLGLNSFAAAFSQSGTTAYVSAPSMDQVVPIDVVTGTAGTSIDVGDSPQIMVAYH